TSTDYAPLSTSNNHIIHQNGSIVLPNIQKENEGLYKCNISNGIGDSLVKAVVIKLRENNKMKITGRLFPFLVYFTMIFAKKSQASDVNLKIQSFNFPATPIIGQRVNTMCATVIATDKMEFYWSKSGSDLKKSNRVQIMVFPQFSSLIIDPLVEDDSGNYTCTVMSKGTSDTYTAALNVLTPLYGYTSQLILKETVAKVFFSIGEGLGKPRPSSKWTKLSGIDKEVTTLENSEYIHIHLNGSLEIRQIDKETGRLLSMYCSNGVGTELKKDVNIKVIDTWKIQPFTFPIGSRIGQRISTTCTTTGGKKPIFEWLKDGKVLKEGHSIKFSTIYDVSTIVIESVSENDSGNYTCVANSEGISDSFTTPLNVNVPPEWITIPSDKEILSFGTVIIPCEAIGKPKPITTWGKYNDIDGKYYPIVPDSSQQDRIFVSKNGSLKISEVNKGDDGIYQCIVSNDIGGSLTKSATLKVIVMITPKLIQRLMLSFFIYKFFIGVALVTAEYENWKIQPFIFPPMPTVGTRATGVCSTTSGKGLQFQWMKNGKIIDKSSTIEIRSYTDSSMIVIEPLTETDSGNYTCVVKSDFMTDSFTASLVVLIPPTWVKYHLMQMF
ncbi:hypothetical protein JTE90_000473, partial [Oedothorax gibbosus]